MGTEIVPTRRRFPLQEGNRTGSQNPPAVGRDEGWVGRYTASLGAIRSWRQSVGRGQVTQQGALEPSPKIYDQSRRPPEKQKRPPIEPLNSSNIVYQNTPIAPMAPIVPAPLEIKPLEQPRFKPRKIEPAPLYHERDSSVVIPKHPLSFKEMPAIVKTRNHERLVNTLADRFSQESVYPLSDRGFKAELVSQGISFSITPLEIEPLTFEDVLKAPLEVKVNLLANGAARLEKRKHEPPPLTRRETQALEKRKGQILKAIDNIVGRGTESAGRFIASRWGKTGLSVAGMTGLALASSACSGRVVTVEPIPLEPTVEESEPPTPIELPEPTVEQLPTPITANITSPYPATDEGFLIGAGGPDVAEERIRELGAGGDVEKMKGMIIAEMNRTGINSETIEWEFAINEQAENPSWTMWPKDRISGQFLLPKLTSGPDAGQLIRSGNLFAYLDREIGDDFFDLVELQNPEGLVGVEQRIVKDMSGWFVPGGFDSEGEILNWFSVDTDEWITLAGEVAIEAYETEALSFPGVFGVEERNGSLVAVDGRGLSLYRLSSESGEWNEIPTIKPSDITDAHRAYFRDRGQGRKAAPWGLYYSPPPYGNLSPEPEDGINIYLISGILMETPWLERDNVVVFMLGIPNPNGEFSLIKVERELVWYKDANPQSGELLYPYYIGGTTPKGGYSLDDGTLRIVPLEEAIDLYSKAVGRQIAMEILLGSSPERLREYLLSTKAENFCHNVDWCVAILENIGGKLDETFVTAEQIKAGDYRGFDGKELVTFVDKAYVPYYPKD